MKQCRTFRLLSKTSSRVFLNRLYCGILLCLCDHQSNHSPATLEAVVEEHNLSFLQGACITDSDE